MVCQAVSRGHGEAANVAAYTAVAAQLRAESCADQMERTEASLACVESFQSCSACGGPLMQTSDHLHDHHLQVDQPAQFASTTQASAVIPLHAKRTSPPAGKRQLHHAQVKLVAGALPQWPHVQNHICGRISASSRTTASACHGGARSRVSAQLTLHPYQAGRPRDR